MTNRLTMAAILVAGFAHSTFAGEEAIPDESKKKPKAAATIKIDAETFYNKGRDSLFRGKYEDAIKSLKAAVEADGKQTSYRLYLARAYRYAKKPEQSEKLLAEILKQAPDHVEAGQLLKAPPITTSWEISTWPKTGLLWPPGLTRKCCSLDWTASCCITNWRRPTSTCGNTSVGFPKQR